MMSCKASTSFYTADPLYDAGTIGYMRVRTNRTGKGDVIKYEQSVFHVLATKNVGRQKQNKDVLL